MITFMFVDENNRYEVAAWCNENGCPASIVRDTRPGLMVSAVNGQVRAYPGDLVLSTEKGFVVFTPKLTM